MKHYYIHDGQDIKGPLSRDQLLSLHLNKETPLWYEGLKKWSTIGSIAELLPESQNGAVIKLIIADDHVLYREGVRNTLASKQDINIIAEAENGAHLINLLKGIRPDVILLDIQMPVMDGFTALLEIKKAYPCIKVIMLTMMDDYSMIEKCIELGANGYLTKDSDAETIYQAIKTCRKEEFYFNALTNKVMLNHFRKRKAFPVRIQPQEIILPEKVAVKASVLKEEIGTHEMAGGKDSEPLHAGFHFSNNGHAASNNGFPASKMMEDEEHHRENIFDSFTEATELVPERDKWELSLPVLISVIIFIISGIFLTFFFYN